MSELPEGWVIRRVEEVFDSFSGGTPSRSNPKFWGGAVPWLSSGDIKSDTVETSSESITQQGLENSSAKLCPDGSVLVVVRSGILKHTLPVAILARPAAINQDIKCLDSHSPDLNRWLALALKNAAKQVLALNRQGTTVQSVTYETLKRFELWIPPPNEQRRIVAKLEPLLAKAGACQERLAKIPLVLKRFRQSVLAAACSGRLTAGWRERNPETQEEGSDDSTRQKDVERLPRSWIMVGVGEVIDSLKYGTAQKCGCEKLGVPVLRIPNIGEGIINLNDLKYAQLPENEFQQLRLIPGDLLLIRSNGSVSLVGKCARVREEEKDLAYAGYLIRLRPNQSRILPEYLNLALSSDPVRVQIEIPARSTSGVHNINSDEVRSLRIPLPGIEEQGAILRRVEALLRVIHHVHERYRKAQLNVDKLAQAILAKTFRGELVPTEAQLARDEGREYEPASVLLNRISESHDTPREMRDGSRPSRKTPSRKASRK